ncbi:MAG: TonB-dependent receptor [Niastella sp.]|nr:TonB-dependent receptor [Niastella sp.]
MGTLINKKLFIIVALLACAVNGAWAQQRTLKGKVLNSKDRSPVAGASVYIKGSKTGSATDATGSFSITTTENVRALTVSSVGFSSREVGVGAGVDDIEVLLEQAADQGEDVVVVGYVRKSKKDLTGSVVRVAGDEIRNMPLASADQLLQGKAAGVQISSQSGTPGGGVTVRVRGTSSFSPNSPASQPLYIVDGVFINTTPLGPAGYGTEQQIANPLADINPADIESIDILKDANATSIYGSRGANGVVIITTKRGSYNRKTKIGLNTYYGTAKAWRLPEVTNGPETAKLLNEIWVNDGKNAANLPYPNAANEPTYDRIPEIFRTAGTYNIDLSASGGGDKTSFYIGGGYFKQDGIVRPLTFDRANFRLNLDHQLSRNVRFGTSNTFSRSYRTIVPNDNSTGVLLTGLGNASLYPTYNADGTYYRGPVGNNAVALIKESRETSTSIRAISNMFLDWEIIPRLQFRTSWSVDFNDARNRAFSNTALVGPGGITNGYESSNRQFTWINEQTLRYGTKVLGGNPLNILVGNTIQKTVTNSFGVGAANYPNDDLNNLSSAAQAAWWSGGKVQSALASFFGRFDFTLSNKYIFDVNMRGDASSRFGANNRWGFFPSAGFAWVISNEDFLQNSNTVSRLKFKTSYGLTGSQETIAEFASKGLWGGNDNYNLQPGTRPVQLANPDLKWEQTKQFNAGVEFGLFNNRLEGEINYYNKMTEGVLLNQPVPNSTGFSTIAFNGGDMSNKGIEFTLNAGVIRNSNFRWDVGLNVAHNKNNIDKLNAPYFEPFSRNFIIFQQGYPVNGFRLWQQERVDPQTGNAVYTDVDKNGVIDDRDRLILGSNQPDVLGGLNSSMKYKNFDFSFAFSFEWGQEVVNWNTFFLIHGGTRYNAATGKATYGFYKKQLDRWQKPGDITDIPKVGGTAAERSNNYGLFTSRALEDGSWTRLRNVTLGYTLPAAISAKAGMSYVRVYIMGTNLWTITDYSGLDPEVNAGGGKGTVGGVEMFTVPQPRSFQAGISVTF